MGKGWLAALALLGGMAGTSAAQADDPHDPSMRSAAARARDHAIIRRMNLRELAKVRKRDAEFVRREHSRRARYEQEMAAWRRAVAACRAGDYRYCAR